MSTCSSVRSPDIPMTLFYKTSLSPPSSSESQMEDWALMSMPSSVNTKKAAYKEGIYDPGSGEICTKYIPMSDSTVQRHLYYAYPCIKDPGIKEALLESEHIKHFPLDGQELYLDWCEEMKVIPVRSFLRGLLGEVIDLKYYGVNPIGVRAMSIALTYNRYVRRLDLTSNFLTEDACYHLGQMLADNVSVQELILSRCRIEAGCVKRIVVCLASRPLEELDLSYNGFGDIGFEYLAQQIFKGAVIKRLNLSYNNLSSEAASSFAAAIEVNNKTTHLDLSWNKMSSLKGVNELLSFLGESEVLVNLNMSWNNLTISKILKKLLSVKTLRVLDLSNNKLEKEAAKTIANSLKTAKSLHTLDLSFNPLYGNDAYLIVRKLRSREIKLVNLFMDNIEVDKKFVKERQEVLKLSFRKKCKITHGEVKHGYILSQPDIREIILKRMDYVTSRGHKKNKLDIALYFLQKIKTCDYVQPREILRDMRLAGQPLDEDLVLGLIDIFPGPKLNKGGKTLDLTGVVEMIQRFWPDRKLLPTPEPEVEEPQPIVPDPKKKKKRNKIAIKNKEI